MKCPKCNETIEDMSEGKPAFIHTCGNCALAWLIKDGNLKWYVGDAVVVDVPDGTLPVLNERKYR